VVGPGTPPAYLQRCRRRGESGLENSSHDLLRASVVLSIAFSI
jgi:hypothetical protein